MVGCATGGSGASGISLVSDDSAVTDIVSFVSGTPFVICTGRWQRMPRFIPSTPGSDTPRAWRTARPAALRRGFGALSGASSDICTAFSTARHFRRYGQVDQLGAGKNQVARHFSAGIGFLFHCCTPPSSRILRAVPIVCGGWKMRVRLPALLLSAQAPFPEASAAGRAPCRLRTTSR